jgi:hypothetical protein
MKRVTFTVPSMPLLIGLVLAFLLGTCVSTFTTQVANGAAPRAAITGPLTGCVGSNPTANGVKVNLGGRVITPSTILRLEPTGTCAQNESSVSWNTTSDTEYVSTQISIPGLNAGAVNVPCPNGKQAISGGFVTNINLNLTGKINVVINAPGNSNSVGYWAVEIANLNDPNQPNTTATVTAYAICQTLAPGIVPQVAIGKPQTNGATPDSYVKLIKLNN